ncbi:MAG: sedoheptulose 7-phosphate cyclase [Acidobacteriota bacterium]|nr:sedoheptulose 7-phosphate cyclase [Acidobacteriota bacterium]
MITLANDDSILVAEHCEADKWLVHIGGRTPVAAISSVSDTSGSFTTFAEEVAAVHGGPQVRLVILILEGEDNEPKIISRSPRFVCKISPAQAIAFTADRSWEKFLLVQTEPALHVSSMIRMAHGLFEQATEVCRLNDIAPVGRILGVQHCIWVRTAAEFTGPQEDVTQTMTVKTVGHEAVVAGALAYACLVQQDAGVWIQDNRTATMRVTRTFNCSVIHPARPVFDSAEPTLREIIGGRPVLMVSDAKVAKLYRASWTQYAQKHLRVSAELMLPISEDSKSWKHVEAVCRYAARYSMPRNAVILAIGGGVTLDVAGLAAALYRRGISYVRVPTTLVGLVDVAIGVKQGVNASGKKNLLGAFYAPLANINDYRFVKTLPRQEIACGIAEIVKIALIRDAPLFQLLENHSQELVLSRFDNPPEVATEVALRAELLMMEELAPNLFEDNLARLVDFGHTFSPAIEALSHYQIPHGHAVALDIVLSLAIAVGRGIASSSLLWRVATLFSEIGFTIWDHRICGANELFHSTENVKKHRAGALNLVVVSEPAKPLFLQELRSDEVHAAANWMRDHTRRFLSTSNRRACLASAAV